MTRTEEIEHELLDVVKKGKPLDTVYEKYKGSKGPLYNALGRAFAIVMGWIEKAGSELNETISEGSKAKASLQAAVGRKKEVEGETRNAERRCAELHETGRKHEENVKEILKRLGGLKQEYEQKRCEEEANLQRALKPLKSELDRTKSEITTLKEETGKRGLSPKEALDSLRKLGDLKRELENLSAMVDGERKELDRIRRERKKEEDDTASKRKELSRRWDVSISKKREEYSELEAREKRLKGALQAIGGMINVANQTVEERRQQVQNFDYQIAQLQDKFVKLEREENDKLKEITAEGKRKRSALQGEFARLEQEGNDKLKEIALEGQRRKSVLQDEIVDLEGKRDDKIEEIRSTTEILNSCQDKIARIDELLKRVESLKQIETERVVEEIRKGVQERVTPILEKVARDKQALADQTGGAEIQRIRVMALATRLGDSEEKLKVETARVSSFETNVKDLEGKLESTAGELKSLKAYKVQFIDGKELTLAQTKSEFISVYTGEIKKRSEEKYQALKSDYNAKMPQLIGERLLEVLKKPPWPVEIANIISTKTNEQTDGILRNRREWPGWFLKYYLNEVSTRLARELDDEFNERVNKKSQEIAVEKLEQLKGRAWPTWFSQNVKPAIDRSIFKALKGSWAGWRCDKCGTEFGFTLAERDIGELLKNGGIDFTCPNSDCIDYSWLGWRSSRHKIRITLERLIARTVERAEVPTAELVPGKKAASTA